MPDRENVITHLQIIHTWASFAREHDLQFFTPKHLEDIAQWADDAVALLKEQQEQIDRLLEESASTAEMAEGLKELLKEKDAVEPKKENDGEPEPWTVWWYVCGDCGQPIDKMDRYCRGCGKQVKWE